MSQKQDLQKLITDVETKKFRDGEAKGLMSAIGAELTKALTPVFQRLSEDTTASMAANFEKAVKAITVNVPEPKATPVDVRLPEMKMPDFPAWPDMPEIKIPPIVIPEIKIPPISMPDHISIEGAVSLKGVNNKNPLPVMLMGPDGKPFQASQSSGGMGGGPGNFFTIKDIQNSTGGSIIDNDGNVKVAGSFSVTASNNSTQIIDSSNTPVSQANPLPVTVVSGGTATTASALVDSSGVQYSGSNPLPTSATLSVPQGQGDAATAMRVVIAGNSDASVTATQVGTWNIATVTTITNSVSASIVDSSGVQYSGSNPVPITVISGALTSTVAVGDSAARAADNGGNPVKIGGIARTTNPSAYADGDRSNIGTDKIGRAINRPVQVRDLIKTAYVTLSTGTEATLIAGVSGAFLDLIYVIAANTSSAAQQLDIRATTAGNIVASLYIPANSSVGFALPVPFPQDNQGNNWTVDMADVTNSNILVSALFSQEI